MRQALRLHPDTRWVSAARVEVDVSRPRLGALLLRYVVSGAISDLRLPPVSVSVRADGLWRCSCFEAFVRAAPEAAYYEFNFAPSMQWAAYRFDGYRSGMTLADVNPPRIEVRSSDECYELHASLTLNRLPDLPLDVTWQVGLSAVIEETDGRKSYWALAYPLGDPDFHHPDCFALELPAAKRA